MIEMTPQNIFISRKFKSKIIILLLNFMEYSFEKYLFHWRQLTLLFLENWHWDGT